MSRRLLASVFAFGLALLPAAGQSYQTQFGEVKFDRSQGPATWHGGVEVNEANGALSVSLPLGPGIGARGLKYQPVLKGNWSPQLDVQSYQLSGGTPNTYTFSEIPVVTSNGGFDFTPGFLNLAFSPDNDSFFADKGVAMKAPTIRLTNYQGPDGLSGSLIPDVDEPGYVPTLAGAQALIQAYGFGSGWDVGNAIWQTATGGPGSRFIRRGPGGELVIGLYHPTLAPEQAAVPIVGDSFNQGSSTPETYYHFPSAFLVVQGDRAYHFTWRSNRYSSVEWTWYAKSMTSEYATGTTHRFILHAAFAMTSMRNRTGDRVDFAKAGNGWTAKWFTSTGDTGVAIAFDGTTLTYQGVDNAPSFHLEGQAQSYPQNGQMDGLSMTSSPTDKGYDGFKGCKLSAVVNDVTTERVTLGYYTSQNAQVNGSYWDYPTSVTFPDHQLTMAWDTYEYLRNQQAQPTLWHDHWFGLSDNSKTAGYKFLPVYFRGVVSLTDSSLGTTTYERRIPTPDRKVPGNWVSTAFTVLTVRPDYSSTITRYAEPTNGVVTGSTPDTQMQILAFLKHQPIEIRHYASGVNRPPDRVGLSSPDLLNTSTAGASPWVDLSQSVAHRAELFDRWDLRTSANPDGASLRNAVPYATRKRVWDKLNQVLQTTETTDWDDTQLGWKSSWTLSQSQATAPATAAPEARSLSLRQVAPAYVAPSDGVLRLESRQFISDRDRWVLALPTFEQKTAQADTTPGKAAAAVVPMGLPPTTKVYDTAVPMLGRVSEVQVGMGALQLKTLLTYKGNDGMAAAQLDVASLQGPNQSLTGAVGATYGYDYLLGQMAQITPTGASWSLQQATDGLGRATTQTDANGLTQAFTWDGGMRLRTIQPPNGEVGQTLTPDADLKGMLIQQGNQRTRLRFNAQGKVILEQRSNDGSAWTSFRASAYDTGGRMVGQTIWTSGAGSDALGSMPNLTANSSSLTYTAGHWEYPDYDANGNGIGKPYWEPGTYDTTGGTAQYKGLSLKYDTYGREVLRTDANGVATATTYGVRSKSVTVGSGADQMTTHFVTDAAGRLIKVVDAKNQVTTYAYDAADRILDVKQYPTSTGTGVAAVGTGTPQVRNWAYDSLGRTVVLDQPESGVTYYTAFNVLGKATKTVYGLPRAWRPTSLDAEDASAYTVSGVKTLTTLFDALGRVSSTTSSDGSVSHTLVYDEAGRGLSKGKLTTASTGQGVSRQLSYGGLNGRLSGLTRVVDAQAFAEAFGWNLDGTLASRTYPNHATPSALGPVQTLAYDTYKGLPNGTGYGAANLATLAYDATHWGLNGITFGNNASSFFVYSDDQTRLKSMTYALPTGTLKSWGYTYDTASRLSTDGEDYYTYDALGRLTMAYVRDPFNANTGQGLRQVLTYDPYGNRTGLNSLKVTNWTAGAIPPGSPTTTALTGDPRDLRSYTMNATEISAMASTNRLPSTVGGVTTGAVYDPLGNLTNLYRTPGSSTTQIALGYDALSRVSSLSDSVNATSQTYLHDDEGLRIKVYDSKTNKTTYNLYNEARQLIATYEKVGTGALTWKKDILYVGTKEVAEVDSVGKTWVTFVDHLGSPRLIWDGTANPVKGTNLIEQKFMPFGESLANPTDAAKFAKGFTNHEQTDASGLIYMQARFYAPWFGRFLSPDPARDQHFEETQSWNIYSYVQNDPTMHFDPDGMAMQTPDGHDVARTVVNLTPVAGGVAMFRDGVRGTTHVAGQDVPLGTGARWFNGIVGGLTAVTDVGTFGLDDEITGPIRELVNLATTANALNNLRQAANANLQEKKDAKAEEKKAEAKPEAKAGTAANGQATDKYGNKLGGSGKAQQHTKTHSSKKRAKDAGRNEGKGAPEKHPSPANPDQGPHYHPTDASGEKVPNSTHHEYPKR